MNRLKDKVAIITGAAQGVGLGIADGLAKENASIVMVDINYGLAEKKAKVIETKYEKTKIYLDTINS